MSDVTEFWGRPQENQTPGNDKPVEVKHRLPFTVKDSSGHTWKLSLEERIVRPGELQTAFLWVRYTSDDRENRNGHIVSAPTVVERAVPYVDWSNLANYDMCARLLGVIGEAIEEKRKIRTESEKNPVWVEKPILG